LEDWSMECLLWDW